jgi:hypothetical protein
MGFSDARKKAVKCLREGRFLTEDREVDPGKNLLSMGLVDAGDVERALLNCRGDKNGYEQRPHHDRKKSLVHIFKSRPWYIKLYFMDPECVFISVHRQNEIHY